MSTRQVDAHIDIARMDRRGTVIPVDADADFIRTLLGELLFESPQGVLVTGADGAVVAMNPAFGSLLGIDPGAHEARLSSERLLAQALSGVRDPEGFARLVTQLLADQSTTMDLAIEMADGRGLAGSTSALRSTQGEYLGRVIFLSDISDHRRRQDALASLASTDDLTGVANRRRFAAAAAAAFARARQSGLDLSIVMLDVDHLKRINDTHGHFAGDEVLRLAVVRWTASIRADDLLARLGGDEFAVLLLGAGADAAVRCAERLRADVRSLKVTAGQATVGTTATAGVGVLRDTDTSVRDIIARADAALYEAKQRGRDRVGPISEIAPNGAPLRRPVRTPRG